MTSNMRSDVIPETHKVEQEINSLWEVIEQSLERSGYARPNKEGILRYELFPNRYTGYLDFEKKALEAKQKYKQAQSREKSELDHPIFDDPQYAWVKEHMYYPGSKRDDRVQTTFKNMEHIFRMAKIRASFTEHLQTYIEVRASFEDTCSSVSSMVNMMISTGTKSDEVPSKMKTKIQQLIQKGMKQGIKTAEKFDTLALWSMKVKPQKQGSYSWFSLRHKNEIIPREPYHLFIDPREAEDIHDVFSDLVEAAKVAAELGVEIDSKYIEEHNHLMTPKHTSTLEGQQIYFCNLFEKR